MNSLRPRHWQHLRGPAGPGAPVGALASALAPLAEPESARRVDSGSLQVPQPEASQGRRRQGAHSQAHWQAATGHGRLVGLRWGSEPSGVYSGYSQRNLSTLSAGQPQSAYAAFSRPFYFGSARI